MPRSGGEAKTLRFWENSSSLNLQPYTAPNPRKAIETSISGTSSSALVLDEEGGVHPDDGEDP